jgi:predicted metal-binding membrane protein
MRVPTGLRPAVRRHAVVAYVVAAYVLGWSWYLPLALRGDVVRTGAAGRPTYQGSLHRRWQRSW